MRKVIACLLIFCSILCLCSCQKHIETEDKGNITQSEKTVSADSALNLCIYNIDTLNPLISKSEYNVSVLNLMYDGLFMLDEKYTVISNLCDSYTVSDDGTSYSLHIKKGVYFHDGNSLNPDDVVFSFDLARQSEGIYAKYFTDIKSVIVSGENVVVALNCPRSNFISLLTFPVVRAESSVKASIDNMKNYLPVGTGKYKQQSYKESRELFLVPNENYHLQKIPKIKAVVIYLLKDKETAVSSFENGVIDCLSTDIISFDEYTLDKNYNSFDFTSNRFCYLGINNQLPTLLDEKVRKALSLAINRTVICQDVAGGHAVSSALPVNPTASYFSDNILKPEYNMEQAKILLSECGYNDVNADGIIDKDFYGEIISFHLEILVNSDNIQRVRIAKMLEQSFELLGIDVNILETSFDEYNSRIQSGNFDCYIAETDFSQAQELSSFIKTDSNFFNFSNEEIDIAVDKVSKNSSELKQNYEEMCRLLDEHMPVIGIYFKNKSLIIDKAIIGEINPSPSDMFFNIEKWSVAK